MQKRGINLDLKLGAKPQALALIKQIGASWKYTDDEKPYDPLLEIELPEGIESEDGCTCLLCFDWEDVVERLRSI